MKRVRSSAMWLFVPFTVSEDGVLVLAPCIRMTVPSAS